MDRLPTGTVTFLMTDIEGSTPLHEQFPDAMRQAMVRHDALAETFIKQHNGFCDKKRGEGDSLFTAFHTATEAIAAALSLQRAFLAEAWPEPVKPLVRMAIHTGEAEPIDNDYRGPTPNRCARLRDIAHGRQILMSQTTYNIVIKGSLPPQCSVKDLGEHRLRDVGTEHVWQLLHPELPSHFRPLRSLDVLPNNLPQSLTSFIGRERELDEIEMALLEARLLTLHGAGGCGKTRLALEVAAKVQDSTRSGEGVGLFKEGVWLVKLEKLSEADHIAQEIATALGIRETGRSDLNADLINYLSSKSLLLILDNCEHLREACAFLAEKLLLDCPSLRILATSRDALHIDAETIYPVPPLEVPDPAHLPPLEELANQEAMRLFVERARAVQYGFALTAQNAASIANICRRLDGLPFAIELVAAQVYTNTIKDIEKDLYPLLAEIDGSETAHDRHRTFEALMDWSFELLAKPGVKPEPMPELQTLMRRLSVFAGGWDLDAARSVCSGNGLRDTHIRKMLNRLSQASLLISETQNDTTRYRLLETVRAYAKRKLEESGETEAVQDRHIEYYLGLAEEAEPFLSRKEQAFYLAQLKMEHDNLRLALTQAVDSEIRLRLVGALGRFWTMQGYFSEGRAWLQGALERSRNCSPYLRAKAMNGLGILIWRQSDHASALKYVEASLALFRELKDESRNADALNNIGNILREQKQYERAHACFEESLTLQRKLEDDWSIAATLNNLGIVCQDQENYDESRNYFEESLLLYRKLGDCTQIASVSNNLALIAYAQSDYDTARPLCEESLETMRTLGNRWGIAITLHNLGEILHRQGHYAEAKPLLIESLILRRELGDKAGCVYPLSSLAELASNQGRYEQAARLYGITQAVIEAVGMPMPQSERKLFEQKIVQLRAVFGISNFELYWKMGNRMSFDEAIHSITQYQADI